MTVRYVWSGSGSPGSPYATWATASHALSTVTALMGAGDITYVASTHAETLGVTTQFTIAGTRQILHL